MASALLVGELERAYLAEIIHDDVLQILGAGLLCAELCEQSYCQGRQELLPGHLANLRGMLEQAVARLRHLMADLRPYQHQSGGLEEALRSAFSAFLERNGGTIAFSQTLEHDLTNEAELLSYRVLVEALWSVQNLDEPLEISVSLRNPGDCVEVEVLFRPMGVAGPAALVSRRLALLRWRVQAFGGSLVEETGEPSHTQLRLRLPLSTST